MSAIVASWVLSPALAGIIAVLLGAALVAVLFPRRDEERRLLAEYHAEDSTRAATPPVLQPRPAGVSPTGAS